MQSLDACPPSSRQSQIRRGSPIRANSPHSPIAEVAASGVPKTVIRRRCYALRLVIGVILPSQCMLAKMSNRRLDVPPKSGLTSPDRSLW